MTEILLIVNKKSVKTRPAVYNRNNRASCEGRGLDDDTDMVVV